MTGINQRQLEAFRAVMLTGSMTAGASHLRVTQPAVTRLVRDLERKLGFRLFERLHGRLTPTPHAVELYPEVEKCFVGLDRITKAASDIRQGRAGRLRIAAIPALAAGVLPHVIATYLAGRPQIRVDLVDGSSPEIAQWVAEGSFDLGFATPAAVHPSVDVHPLCGLKAVAVMSNDHPLAAQPAIRPGDLQGHPLVMLAPTTRLRMQLDDALKEAGIEPMLRIETPLSSVACALAAAGVGIAIVEAFIADLLQGLKPAVRPFKANLINDYAMLTLGGRGLSAAVIAFMEQAASWFGQVRKHGARRMPLHAEPAPS